MSKIHIAHLYPVEMNIYGDTGNRIVLTKRLEWRGIDYKLTNVGVGDPLPLDADLIIGGGGQDANQQLVETDFLKKARDIAAMRDDHVPMLMICGMYQLFGQAFITLDDVTIKGAGIMPLFTQAKPGRLIGNVVVESEFGRLVGYENHSGRTYLEEGCVPLGKVISGAGNNGEDGHEGARCNNVFGSYMHGPMLSKNPKFADELLSLAADRHNIKLTKLDDKLENLAAELATKRPR